MPKTALVLNGCGARGAFQFMAEKYAREQKGFCWDIIAGVSVGALNGVMISMRKYERLERIWKTITRERVYSGRMNPWTILKLALGAKSIFRMDPLCRLIEREVDVAKMTIPVRVGTVSLCSGEYRYFTQADSEFKAALLASAAIPLVWPPVDISPAHRSMVDGAVRNISPLGDVLDSQPDQVVIIDCSPPEPVRLARPPRNILEIGRRALEIASHEIFVTDYTEFIRINKNVREAAAHGITLYNEKGKPFRAYEYFIIDPQEPLGDPLDFTRRSIDRAMEVGWERARQVLG